MDQRMAPPRAELLAEHAEFIRVLARSLLGDAHAADDVVQETLLVALKKPLRPGPLRGWMAAVARHIALRARRSRQRRERRERAAARPESLPSVDEGVARLELQRLVVDEVLALDEPYRSTIVHRFFHGLAPREIARRFDLPVETVRTRLKRALAQLRGRLDAAHDGDRRLWSLALLPLARPARAGLLSTTIGGALVMTAKLEIAAVFVLVAGLVWLAAQVADRTETIARAPAAAPASGSASPAPRAREPAASPPPVDFARIDRDRDLFGVVVDEGGIAVAGASVASVSFPWGRGDLPGREARRAQEGPETRAGGRGRFVLRLERGEEVTLRVAAPGLASLRRRWCQAGGFLRIVMRRPATLSVRARDERGRPVSGVHLMLAADPWAGEVAGGGSELGRRGLTDAAGRFVFEGLPYPARAPLVAWHPGYGLAQVDLAGEAEVELALVASRAVAGTVTDAATGRPLAGVRVTPMPRFDFGGVETGEDGRFRHPGSGLEGMWGGRLFAVAEGYALAVRAIRAGVPVDFALERGETVRGRLADEKGAPVAGAFVTAVGVRGDGPDGIVDVREGRSDATGAFSLGALRADLPHTLVVLQRGHGRYLVDFDPGIADLGTIVLPSGRRVEGCVVDTNGNPVTGVEVTLDGANRDRDRLRPGAPRTASAGEGEITVLPAVAQFAWGRTERRHTDDLGRFRFRDLAPGFYALRADWNGRTVTRRKVEVDGDVGGLVLRFAEGRDFAVLVVDGTGRPLQGADVFLNMKEGGRRGRTGRDGRVRFRLPLDTAEVSVAARMDDRPRVGSGAFDTHRVADGEFRLVLEASAPVTGQALGPDGRPLAGALIRFGEKSVVADSEGRFKIDLPEGGQVDLSFRGQVAGGWRPLRGELRGVAAGSRGVILRARRLPADRTLRVRAVAPDGSGLEGIRFHVTPAENWARRRTDAGGRVEFTGLAATEVHLIQDEIDDREPWRIWAPPRRRSVRLVPDGQEVVFRFRRPNPIRGVFAGPLRRGEQVTVHADRGENDFVGWALARADGSFRINVAADEPEPVRLRVYSGARLVATVRDVAPGTTGLRIEPRR